MDKKNTIIGILLIAAAIFMMSRDMKQAREEAEQQQAQQQQVEPSPEATAATPDQAPPPPSSEGGSLFDDIQPAEPKSENNAPLTGAASDLPEKTFELANDYIRVTFTSKGGGIKKVAFIDKTPDGRLKYPATLGSDEPYLFNDGAEKPALALSWQQDGDGMPDEITYDFIVAEKDETTGSIIFACKDPSGRHIYREYKLAMSADEEAVDPYLIQHRTTFENSSGNDWSLSALFVNVGSAPPTKGDVTREFLNFGYYAADDADFWKMSKFTGSKGFMGIGRRAPRSFMFEGMDEAGGEITWASIKNQFFASVLTPSSIRGSGVFAKPIDLSETIEDPDLQKGLTGAMEFNLGKVSVNELKSIEATYYVGPKEYFRLSTLGQDQDEIMQFGFFGGISKILLYALVSIHDVIVGIAPTWGWGFAIIILTCIIKGLLWPLTQVQVRSAKAMGKIQGPMKELQEKHKDNPQKLQQETMKLFKENKVNPAAGCLPILLQIPIFFALFYMLRTSSDLRFAPFLWIKDLSVPDTLPFLPDWFHLLPLFMGGAMFLQMRMTPTPTTDNMQRKIFQFMPLIFTAFCYQFPSGLVLYWTVQNCISILQQWLTNRKRDDEPADQKDSNVIDVTEDKPKPVKKRSAPPPKKRGKKKR